MEMKRNVTLFVTDKNEELEQVFERLFNILKYLNRLAFQDSRDNYKGKKRGSRRTYGDKYLAEHPEVKEELVRLGLVNSVQQRTFVRDIFGRYIGYENRNGEAAKRGFRLASWQPIVPADKGMFRIKDGNVEVRILDDKWIAMPFYLSDSQLPKFEQVIEDGVYKFCGQLTRSKRKRSESAYVIKMVFNEDIKFTYEPVGCLGIDINKEKTEFIHFSKPIPKVPHTTEIERLTALLIELNSVINDRSILKRGERRKKRKAWFATHNKQKQAIQPIIRAIVDYAVEHQLMIGIDDAKTGANMGSYGQDKVIDGLKTLCENEGVPHFLTPPYYTSKLCHKCHGVGRRDGKVFTCDKCGEMDANENGAKNIEYFAWYAWTNGLTENQQDYWKIHKIQKEMYFSQTTAVPV